MIKIELHTHTADDPADLIPHTTQELIERAAALGYNAVAVTLHDRQLDLRGYEAMARERGVVLIPGIERTIKGKHVLLLNFPACETERVQTLDDVAALRRRYTQGLVIAPHPFFPNGTCLGAAMNEYVELFDAVEQNYFYTRHIDFNEPARAWAAEHDKPVVGNSDLHRLYQMGRTYSRVDAEADVTAIVEAIKAGRVEVRSEPITLTDAATYFADLYRAQITKTMRQLWPQTEPAAA